MICKWLSDDDQEICCNGECPACADFFPSRRQNREIVASATAQSAANSEMDMYCTRSRCPKM